MRAIRPMAVLVTLTAATTVLAITGGGRLAIPLGSVTELAAWVRDTPPAFMAGALLRQLALVLCGYLFVAVLVRAGAQMLGWRSLAVLATRALPVALRQLTGSAGLGITATAVLCASQPAAASERPPAAPVPDGRQPGVSVASMTLLEPPPAPTTATMWLLDDGTGTPQEAPTTAPTRDDRTPGRSGTTPDPTATAGRPTTSTTPSDPTTSNGPTTTPSDPTRRTGPTTPNAPTTPNGPTPPTGPMTAPITPLPPVAGASTGPSMPPGPGTPTLAPGAVEGGGSETWVVEAGDSFWSIAEDVIAEEIGPGYRVEDVDAYWQQLVAANRDRLAVPDQPDLLFTGQVLTLPHP